MRFPTIYVSLFAFVHLLVGCGPAEPAPSPEPERAVASAPAAARPADNATAEEQADYLVLAFGDSLYAGYALELGEGFVPELEKALEERGLDARVHDAGVSGDTTAGGRRRLDFVLGELPRAPDLVILGLGGNDMLRGFDPADIRANLDAMLAELSRRDIPVLLTGMLAAPNLGRAYGEEFNRIYPELARKHGAALYPFFLDDVVTDRKLMLEDGIHPNAEGIDLVVSRVAPLAARELER